MQQYGTVATVDGRRCARRENYVLPPTATHLSSFTGAGLALHHDDLILAHELLELVQELPHRQLLPLLIDFAVSAAVRRAGERIYARNAIPTAASTSIGLRCAAAHI